MLRGRLGLRSALARRLAIVRHRGRAVTCPVCGRSFDHFAAWRGRPGARCWGCDSLERHRALWWYVTEERPELLAGARSLLHFAPEPFLADRLRRRGDLRYVTADLEPGADLRLDLERLELPDGSFDAVICAHVLEHVPDDARAMRELHRVLAPGGWALVMVPVERETTYEDPAITGAAARAEAFGQDDHVRLYGADVEDRLRAAGFAVDAWRAPPERLARHGLLRADTVFCCRKG